MKGNELEKPHILTDFIPDNLFVKKYISIGLFYENVGVTWSLSDSVKN